MQRITCIIGLLTLLVLLSSTAVQVQAEYPVVYYSNASGNNFTIDISWASKAFALKGQLHCHTNNSDGFSPPYDVLKTYKDKGFGFVFITDHNIVTEDPGVDGIIFFRGSEAYGKVTHINALDIKGPAPVTNSDSDSNKILSIIHSEGGLAQLNHLNHPGHNVTEKEMDTLYVPFEFAEIYNPGTGRGIADTQIDYMLSHNHKFLITATDDMHDISYAGLSYIVVNCDSQTREDVWKNLVAGNFFATTGWKASISCIEFDGNRIIVKTPNTSKIVWIKNNGEIIKTTTMVKNDTYEVAGDEGYVRIEVKCDEMTAFSQPIYINRLAPQDNTSDNTGIISNNTGRGDNNSNAYADNNPIVSGKLLLAIAALISCALLGSIILWKRIS